MDPCRDPSTNNCLDFQGPRKDLTYIGYNIQNIFNLNLPRGALLRINILTFRDPERTRLVVDTEGWLHTGDIGEWQLNGTLKIIDRQAIIHSHLEMINQHLLFLTRKKQIFKLSQGEYVAPDSVEEIIRRSDYVAHVRNLFLIIVNQS